MTTITWVELIGLSFSPLGWLVQALSLEGNAQWRLLLNVQACLLAVLVALLLDRLWGEPPVWMHPVVWMGKALGGIGQLIAPRTEVPRDFRRFFLAALAWCALAAIVFMIYWLLQFLSWTSLWWVWGLVMGVLLKPLLSWRMLKDEVLAVESALQQSLPAGRERLTWLVSRDTSQLDAATVRESAIETLAENLSDSVIAPLFWFVVAGLPGAAVYRLANTADAMWGYPGWRGKGEERRHWQWAGKWAARADDVLNWIPARITAFWLAMMAGGVSWHMLRRDAAVTPSPNGGWPMGAMARALNVHLSKPGVYQLNPDGRAPEPADLHRAVALASKVIAVQLGCTLLAIVFLAIWIWRATAHA
ncbi:MAG: adenosylcobinamide-phosphate synthase CbiB [Comamonas sp.]